MHEEKFNALPGKLKRIVLETPAGEWVDDNTYICVCWAYPYHERHTWEVWRGRENGWAELIARDTSAMWLRSEDSIAAARRALALMGITE